MTELNIKSSTVEKGLDLAKDFIQSVIKPSMDEVGELFADKVKLWRVKNQIRNIEKVKAIVEKEGITTKAINMKVLFPYFDAVALEDDETLQDMWANLFVNYIDSENNLTTHVYPGILSQLSTEDINILSTFFKVGISGNDNNIDTELPVNINTIDNLMRLELISSNAISLGNHEIIHVDYSRRETTLNSTLNSYHISRFGHDFYLACTREPK